MTDQYDVNALRRDNPLSAYLPSRGVALERNGREWKCRCPFHSEDSASFTVRLHRKGHQVFHCFGCPNHGDVVEFVQRFDGVDFVEACKILGGERSPPESRPAQEPAPEAPDPYADWRAMQPPETAPLIRAGERTPPLFNPKSDDRPVTSYKPVSVHPYRFASGKLYAYVLRVEIEGKKITPCIAWCRNVRTGEEGWCHYTLAAPRRLYGLERLTERPDAPVIVVEGEKCADALQAALPDHVVVTWAGGGKAASKTDFSPLAGRNVLIWPDRDPAGEETVTGWRTTGGEARPGLIDLIPTEARIARPDAIERVKGWDCADAIAEGWDGPTILAWLDAQTAPEATVEVLRPLTQEKPEAGIPATEQDQRVTRPKPRAIPDTNIVALNGGNVRGQPRDYRADMVFSSKGQLEAKSPKNHYLTLLGHPNFKGLFAKNVFTSLITLRRRPPWDHDTGPWVERAISDDDVSRCIYELDAYEYGNLHMPDASAGRAISAVAEVNRYNPVADYLLGLRWDGVERLYGGPEQDGWLCHYFGAEPHTYHRTVGMRWMIAGAARALSEGTTVEKVDTMLILEGPQGYMKSSALEVLATVGGQRLYTDSVRDFASKDSAMQTSGVLIVEFAELDGMGAKTVDTVKKWMSSKVDRYRPPYGKNVIEAPRRFIVAGTVNPSGPGYLHDPTGARRFWPVACGKPCDLAALARDREQLWAEAVHRYKAGEQWWLLPREVHDAEYQQGLRYHDDPWAGRLDAAMREADTLNLSDLFERIGMPLHRAGNEDKRRVSDHMKTRGWKTVRDQGGERWRRPEK